MSWRIRQRIGRAGEVQSCLGPDLFWPVLEGHLRPGPCTGRGICDYSLRLVGETPRGVPTAQKEETSMGQNEFPDGWDEERVQRVLAHYEDQTEDEALAEDEAGVEPSKTVMNVPRDLVPKVRELIAKHHS